MDHLERLRDRIDLIRIPFTDRGSRILVQRCPDRDALFIRLAERWTALEGPEGKFATRPPFVDDFCLLDGDGARLEFHPVTFPDRIVMETKIGTFALAFVDEETLLLSLPSTCCGIAFRARVDEWQPDRRGAVLRMTGRIRRHLALTTNAPLLENEIASANGGCSARLLCDALEGGQSFLLNITPRHALNRSVPSSAAALDAAAGRWRAWFAAAPAVEDEFARQYYYAWWLMGAGLAAPRDYTSREVLMPSKLKYIGAWAWDAYFHALAYRHVHMRLAHDQLRVMANHQQPDGMLPDAVHDDGSSAWLDHPIPGPVTKPPLLGWAAWKLFETDRDREFLDEIYDAAARNQGWWLQQNDQDQNGLCEYLHPYSSGLDDSPLWDEGTPVESPDLNTYLVLQAQALEKMAGVLGLETEAVRWRSQAEGLVERMIQEMWDPQAGLFRARKNGVRLDVTTPFNLFPLLTGRLPREISDRLVAHLVDPAEFWARFPVPSVARNDPRYSPDTMWRGPTWINVNYLLVEGLECSGYRAVAASLRQRTLELVASGDDIYEYYNPETGLPPADAARMYGWSAALFIDLLLGGGRSREQGGN